MATLAERSGASGRPSEAEALDPAVIGARVKALREGASLSLRELAQRSGVSAPMPGFRSV